MENITLRAHYDGNRILLDDPFELQPDTKLLVTVLQASETNDQDWHDVSIKGLAAAYGDNEPEYPLTLIKEHNPAYERG
jgi:hypothetical protein